MGLRLQLPVDGARLSKDGDTDGVLLPAHGIAGWVVEKVGGRGEWEGYSDEKSRDESVAWIALLEADVQAALVRPSPSS